MAVVVNYLAQMARAFLAAIGNHKAEFAAKGFGDERTKRLEDKIVDMEKKDADQKGAEELLSRLTAEQDELAARSLEIIRSVQNAGQSGLGQTAAAKKEFMIGKTINASVPNLLEALRYFIGLGLKYHDLLLANGMSEAEVVSIGTIYGELNTLDAKQENQKKLRNNATASRNDAMKVLKDEIFKTRKFVKSAFKGDKGILEEFTSTGRGGGGKKQKQPEPPKK